METKRIVEEAYLLTSDKGKVAHIPKYPNNTNGANMLKGHCGQVGVWRYRKEHPPWCAACLKRCPSMVSSVDGI